MHKHPPPTQTPPRGTSEITVAKLIFSLLLLQPEGSLRQRIGGREGRWCWRREGKGSRGILMCLSLAACQRKAITITAPFSALLCVCVCTYLRGSVCLCVYVWLHLSTQGFGMLNVQRADWLVHCRVFGNSWYCRCLFLPYNFPWHLKAVKSLLRCHKTSIPKHRCSVRLQCCQALTQLINLYKCHHSFIIFHSAMHNVVFDGPCSCRGDPLERRWQQPTDKSWERDRQAGRRTNGGVEKILRRRAVGGVEVECSRGKKVGRIEKKWRMICRENGKCCDCVCSDHYCSTQARL